MTEALWQNRLVTNKSYPRAECLRFWGLGTAGKQLQDLRAVREYNANRTHLAGLDRSETPKEHGGTLLLLETDVEFLTSSATSGTFFFNVQSSSCSQLGGAKMLQSKLKNRDACRTERLSVRTAHGLMHLLSLQT